MTQPPFRIGFANLSLESEFARVVQRSLIEAIEKRDNIELIIRDNALNDEIALQNAQYFSDEKFDFVIFFHISERFGMKIQSILLPIPILTIDIPFPMSPHFGINNRQSGLILGQAMADWVQTYWHGTVDKVLALVDSRVLMLRDRAEYAAQTIVEELGIESDAVFYLDCGNDRPTTATNATHVLNTWSEVEKIAAISFNAESTFGLIDAAEQTNSLHKVMIVANAADHPLLQELERPDTHVIAASFFDPIHYGEEVMQLVDKVRAGEWIPKRNFVDMELHRAKQPFVP